MRVYMCVCVCKKEAMYVCMYVCMNVCMNECSQKHQRITA